jgi:hypothetical protein
MDKFDVLFRRQLTDFEEEVLEYIKNHPGLTTYDIAKNWDHSEAIYYAVPYLVLNNYAEQDPRTFAIKVRLSWA